VEWTQRGGGTREGESYKIHINGIMDGPNSCSFRNHNTAFFAVQSLRSGASKTTQFALVPGGADIS
jgi:hypothetical protein